MVNVNFSTGQEESSPYIMEWVNACTIELLLLSLAIIQTGAFLVDIIIGSLIAPFTNILSIFLL